MILSKETEREIRFAVVNDEHTSVDNVSDLLAELDITRRLLREVTQSVLNLRVLRVSCEHSGQGLFRVHLTEFEWDSLEQLCKTFTGNSK